MILIPIISGILYRLGGSPQVPWIPINMKWFRWGMGLFIGTIYGLILHSWIVVILSTVSYYIATSVFKYGSGSWLDFLGEEGKFLVCGLVFGACSFIFLPIWLGILQTIVSGLCWWFIKVIDDKNILKNPWVELFRGFTGTIIYGIS